MQPKNCLLFSELPGIHCDRADADKTMRTPYLGVGHRMGPDPLCGTLQSPSQSARTFCRRNDTKWAEFVLSLLLMHSSSQHLSKYYKTAQLSFEQHSVSPEDFRLFTVEGWEKRFASNIPSVLQNTLTHINTPAMHKHNTLEANWGPTPFTYSY